MFEFDLFHFYRFLLTVLVASYALVRLVLFVSRWQDLGADDPRGVGLLKRYLLVQLFRIYPYLLMSIQQLQDNLQRS